MPSDDYTELRAWLERMGAQCAGTVGHAKEGDASGDFEMWSYGDYAFILVRARLKGVTTGAVALFSRVNDKDWPVSDDIVHLRVRFRAEDIKREGRKHRTSHEQACALAEVGGKDVHYCNIVGDHGGGRHECKCGARWSRVEGDNALLAHPADAAGKKKERVRGFQI